MSLKQVLAGCWYRRCPWLYALAPAAWLFILVSALRRSAYRAGLLPSIRLPVPVIVVGNITAGGTGKTPLVLWLVAMLRDAGMHPGIISRGHGGQAAWPTEVKAGSAPAECGDEPVLLARRAGCPVWIGRRRGLAGRALLDAHPEVNILVCDDGLQHYALERDIEIALIDGLRGLGNGWRLPVGPLREPPTRLDEVDAVVINGAGVEAPKAQTHRVFAMRLDACDFYNPGNTAQRAEASRFHGCSAHAVAGIGHPERFFATLADLGIRVDTRAFPDHHPFRPEDLPEGTVLMTEKDAVKCAGFQRVDLWALRVDARVEDGLNTCILAKLKARHGQQTA
jgi:tetraacyldisaccharide 4'-kinase